MRFGYSVTFPFNYLSSALEGVVRTPIDVRSIDSKKSDAEKTKAAPLLTLCLFSMGAFPKTHPIYTLLFRSPAVAIHFHGSANLL